MKCYRKRLSQEEPLYDAAYFKINNKKKLFNCYILKVVAAGVSLGDLKAAQRGGGSRLHETNWPL